MLTAGYKSLSSRFYTSHRTNQHIQAAPRRSRHESNLDYEYIAYFKVAKIFRRKYTREIPAFAKDSCLRRNDEAEGTGVTKRKAQE